MRKSTKKSLTRKLDKVCSEIVRSRGYCVKCQKTKNLQACHIFSRTYRSVRWDIQLNILCLCAGCHFHAHKNPVLFTEFVRNYLGDLNYASLKRIATSIKKWTLVEMQELYDILKQWNDIK